MTYKKASRMDQTSMGHQVMARNNSSNNHQSSGSCSLGTNGEGSDSDGDGNSKSLAFLNKLWSAFRCKKRSSGCKNKVVTNGPPDGGFGWFVVFGSFMISFIQDGILFTIGVLMSDFHGEIEASNFAISFVPSIMTFMLYITGPFASALCDVYGCRNVSIAAHVIGTFGLAIAAVAGNLLVLILGLGIVAGCGFGLAYLPQSTVILYYFEKRRGAAMGIAVCGSGLGTMVFGPMTESLSRAFGRQVTLLVLAAINITGIGFSMLFRPLYGVEPAYKNEETISTIATINPIPSQPSKNRNRAKLKHVAANLIDLTFLKDLIFIVLGIGAFLTAIGYYIPTTFLVDRANDHGIHRDAASFLYVYYGIANLLGRILCGAAGDLLPLHRFWIFYMTIFSTGLLFSVSSVMTSYELQAAFSSISGFVLGGFVSLLSVIQADLFGLDRASKAFGLQSVFDALGSLAGPPIVGFFRDKTGSYDPGFHFAGAAFLFTAILYLLIPLIRHFRSKKRAGFSKSSSFITSSRSSFNSYSPSSSRFSNGSNSTNQSIITDISLIYAQSKVSSFDIRRCSV